MRSLQASFLFFDKFMLNPTDVGFLGLLRADKLRRKRMKSYDKEKEKLPFPVLTVLLVFIAFGVIGFLWIRGIEAKRMKNQEAPEQTVQTNAVKQITSNSVSASPLVVHDKGARFSIVSQSKDSQAPVAQENPHLNKK